MELIKVVHPPTEALMLTFPEIVNVSLSLNPLTLMEGWLTVTLQNIEDDILQLANRFLSIEHLVDETLVQFKQVSYKPC